MTLNYQDKIPPVDVNHIDYALRRANLGVRRAVIKTPEDLNVVKKRSVGPILYLTLKRLVNPYLGDELIDPNDPTQWKLVQRQHTRFSIQEVLDYALDYALSGEPLAIDQRTKDAVVLALASMDIGATADDIDVSFTGSEVTITSTKPDSYLWWGEGKVRYAIAG